MSLPRDLFDSFMWAAVAIWIVTALGASLLLISEIRRRPIDRLPASGAAHAAAIVALNLGAAVVVCALFSKLVLQIILFGGAVGLVCSAWVGIAVRKHRQALLDQRSGS